MLTPQQQSFLLPGLIDSSYLDASLWVQLKENSVENRLILAVISKMKFSPHKASRIQKYHLTSTPLSDSLIANK